MIRNSVIASVAVAVTVGIGACSNPAQPEPMHFFMGIDGDEVIWGDSLISPELHDPRDSLVGVVHFEFNGSPYTIRAYSDEDYRAPDSGMLKIELEGIGVVYTYGIFSHGRSFLYTNIDSLRPLLKASIKATAQPEFVADNYKYCLPFATNRKIANNDGTWNLTDVDRAPEFPGGYDKLLEHMNKIQQYPDSEYNAGVEGKVFIQFTVNEDGSLDDITILRSISPGFDREAVRLVSSMPNWTVAQLEGKNVRCRVVLPIGFKLTSSSKAS